MSDWPLQVVVALNRVADAVGAVVLAPLSGMPGWLSSTLVAALTGILLLICFKYTSHQEAIRRVRNRIKANLLSIRLFKDSPAVALAAQGRIILDAGRLLVYSLVPMAVMFVPVCLILAQLAQWYQFRPVRIGEEVVVTLNLDPAKPMPDARIESTQAVEIELGPVRSKSKKFVCWDLKARQAGYQQIVFHAGDCTEAKQLAVGDGIMRVSPRRPAWRLKDIVFNPLERPFARTSSIQSIEIAYPQRDSWTSGTDSWVIYWFAISMIVGFSLRGILKVNM